MMQTRSGDQKTDRKPQCEVCGRTLAEYLTQPYSLRCKRCGAQNVKPERLDAQGRQTHNRT